jgi:hypothetical protein
LEDYFSFCVGATRFGEPVSSLQNDLIKTMKRVKRFHTAWVKTRKPQSEQMLRHTLLAPEIVEAIVNGQQAPQITLAVLLGPFPAEWKNQRDTFNLLS